MFDTTTRYYSRETTTYTTSDGRQFTYVRRRFLPRGEDLQLLTEVTIVEGDRLDLIAARTIGDSLQFWRICDANNAMNPFDLTDEAGEKLRVPVPRIET